MPKGTLTFHVRRPPEAVWDRLTDLEQAPRWVPDLESAEKVDAGAVGVGTRYRQVVRVAGARAEADVVVTDYQPPWVFAHEGQGGQGSFSARFELEADGEGTRVHQAWDVRLTGMMRAMAPMVEVLVRRNAKQAAEAFRALLEAEA